LAITLAAVFLAGCVSEKRQEAALARMGDETPPDFLAGPASVCLTNFDGFSANVVATSPSVPGAPMAAGQLIERKGRLIFQPLSTAKIKKGKIVRGGMFFIWDGDSQHGYVVSEALQGYAPISAPSQITIVTAENKAPVSEQANGHSCHRIEKIVALRDGSTAKVAEWRADDLKGFPVRVRTESGGRLVTVDFSDIRLDLAAPELFIPPGGFTRYASASALINELMIRESAMKKGPSGAAGESEKPANWHEPGMPGLHQ
jgi:hypothetical protein